MVLHHVTKSAGLIIITSAPFHSESFGGGDLDMIDVARVPKRLENGVGKAQNKNVLCCFFPEKMIDSICLFLGERFTDNVIELARGREISSERFFDNHSSPAPFGGLV